MKNYWPAALTMSLLFHLALLSKGFGSFKNIFPTRAPQAVAEKPKEIKITPEKIEKIIKNKASEAPAPKPLPYVENIMSKLIKSDIFSPLKKPQVFEKNIKEIIFSQIPKDDMILKKDPAYMNYYRLVREKIRANAYNSYDGNKKGEVIISFLILSDGTLKDLDFHSEITTNEILKNIALKSVKDSAPFPSFPPELSKHSELRFNISIYFKNN